VSGAKRQRDGDEDRREAGVETEELDACLARDSDQREQDADAEVGQEEEENQRPNLLFTSAQLTTFHQAST